MTYKEFLILFSSGSHRKVSQMAASQMTVLAKWPLVFGYHSSFNGLLIPSKMSVFLSLELYLASEMADLQMAVFWLI